MAKKSITSKNNKKSSNKLILQNNKTENAFSPFPARTKASNADMTTCLPLQDCIVQTTSLPAYGRKFLPPRWSPDYKATRCFPAAVAGSQTACMRTPLPCCSHCNAVAGYQTACINACCSGRISNCMRAWLPCCSGRFSNCLIQ
jgi:hypothetical protein